MQIPNIDSYQGDVSLADLHMHTTARSFAAPLALDYLDPRVLSPHEAEKISGFAPRGFTLASDANQARGERIQRIAAAIERESDRNASRSFVFVPVNAAAHVSNSISRIADELVALGHAVEVIGDDVGHALAHAATAGVGREVLLSSAPVASNSLGAGGEQHP